LLVFRCADLTPDPEETVEFSFLSATDAFPEDYQTAYEDPTDEDRDDEATFAHEATFDFEVRQQVGTTPHEDEETNEECVKIDVASESGASNEDSESETKAKSQLIPIATGENSIHATRNLTFVFQQLGVLLLFPKMTTTLMKRLLMRRKSRETWMILLRSSVEMWLITRYILF